MGWKNVKEAYEIGHLVCVTDKGISIGSAYVHDIIVIGMDGEIKKRYSKDGWSSNKDLIRYMAEFEDDPERLKRLIQTPDSFGSSVAVYTYQEGEVLEKVCETTGWPNVTHDGQLMYDNTFSTDKREIIEKAKSDACSGIELYGDIIKDSKEKLEKQQKRLETLETNLAALNLME